MMKSFSNILATSFLHNYFDNPNLFSDLYFRKNCFFPCRNIEDTKISFFRASFHLYMERIILLKYLKIDRYRSEGKCRSENNFFKSTK